MCSVDPIYDPQKKETKKEEKNPRHWIYKFYRIRVRKGQFLDMEVMEPILEHFDYCLNPLT